MIAIRKAEDPQDIERCFEIRARVFIEEQQVPLAIERDEYDASALHFLAVSDGEPAGAARVVFKEQETVAKIGRVAVLPGCRGLGIGKSLIEHIEKSPDLKEVDSFYLEAQTHALDFYRRLGYVAFDDEFTEAGIPHRRMKKRNSK